MLDLGWSEMAVIALVALLVLGPKELPNALRTVALWVRKARKLAREFQSGVDELVREAELEEAKKTVQSVGQVNVSREIEKTIDPTGEMSRTIRSDPIADAKPAETASLPDNSPKPVAGNGSIAAEPATPAESTSAEPIQTEPTSNETPAQPAREPVEVPSSKSA
jgi:sec-independent protein translocase protein TatB